MTRASDILLNTYKVSDCCDFSDISATIEITLCNCSLYNVSLFDYTSVYNRVRGLCKLYYKSEKFRKQSDIDYSKERDSYHDDIMYYVDFFKPKFII